MYGVTSESVHPSHKMLHNSCHLINVFSSTSETYSYLDVRDIPCDGWLTSWVFAGEAEELQELLSSRLYESLTPAMVQGLASALHNLIKQRNRQADVAVPTEVGGYSVGSEMFIVFR